MVTHADMADVLNILVETCPVCKGTGVVVNAEWSTWLDNHPGGELPPAGHGLRFERMDIPCRTCKGQCHRLTEVGHHFFSVLLPLLR